MSNAAFIDGPGSVPVESEVPWADPIALRRVCGAFATGVAIVATNDPSGAPVGLTVNSFTSVSLSPPLVLWSLNRHSPSLPHFDAAEAYTISILADDQAHLAKRFARPQADKFEGVAHELCEKGVPLVSDCLGHLECRPWSRVEAGDHVVFIWHVERARTLSLRAPLAFHGGGYKRISP